MGKILCRGRSKKRSNPVSRESAQREESLVREKKQNQKNKKQLGRSRRTSNQPGGVSLEKLSPDLSPSSLSFSAAASNSSHVSAPALSHNVVENLTINNNFVIQKQPDVVTERIQPQQQQQQQQALPESSSYSVTVLKTPQKRKRLQNRKVKLKAKMLDFNLDDEATWETGYPQKSVTGEIAAAFVSSVYRCGRCAALMPQFLADTFSIKCNKCMHNWRCTKVQCACEAEITLEPSDRQQQLVTLKDSLLRSLVVYNSKGFCDTDQVEKDVLKVGSMRVDFANGAVESVERVPHNQPIRI